MVGRLSRYWHRPIDKPYGTPFAVFTDCGLGVQGASPAGAFRAGWDSPPIRRREVLGSPLPETLRFSYPSTSFRLCMTKKDTALTKIRLPQKNESITWRPRHQRLPPKRMTPTALTESKPVEDAYTLQKRRWLDETKQAESPSPPLGPEENKPQQSLLDNIPENLSPEERHTVILTRLDHMRDGH